MPGWTPAIPTLAGLAPKFRIEPTDVYTAGIAKIGGPEAAAALFRLARAEHPDAEQLLRSLSAEDRNAVSAAHLEDPVPAVRVLALGLLKVATPLVERVRALLADPEPAVVQAAVRALCYQKTPGLAAELWRLRAGGEASLVEAIDRTLATLPHAETWPLVLPGLRAGDVATAGLAEELYSQYGELPADTATLVELLASPTKEVRWFAVDRLRPTVEHAEAMLAAVPRTSDDDDHVSEVLLLMEEPITAARRTAALRSKLLHAMERVAEDSGRPEAERAWMAQRLALYGDSGSVGKAVNVLFELPSGPALLRALVDGPRRGQSCLERLFHRRERVAREVLHDVLRTGTPEQRQLVLKRQSGVVSGEILPWVREALERWIVRGEVDVALSIWGGPQTVIQRHGTLDDVPLLYRVARMARQGAWAFVVLDAIAQLQGRLGRITELPEPTSRALDEAPAETLAWLLAEIHATPVRLRRFVEQVVAPLAFELGWDRGVLPIARDLVEHLDRHGLPDDFFLALEAAAPDRADELAAVRARWGSGARKAHQGAVERRRA